MEGEQGWVMQGILSLALFRRPPVSGQETFTVLSLQISNIYAKKRGIAKKLILTIRAIMVGQQIHVVAGDFNGTAWRCSNRDNISTLDEAFADCALPTPPGPTPLWGLGSIPNNWADVCGFLKAPGSDRFWKVRMHGGFLAKLLAYVQPIKVAIMRHGSTWISSIGAALNHSMMRMTDEFHSKSVLRRTSTASRKGASAIS